MIHILKRMEAAALANPAQIAYRVGSESLTYRELWSISDRYADLLRRQGTSPVILYGGKQPWMPCMMLACLKAGRAYVPVGLYTPQERLNTIIELSGASLLITEAPVSFADVHCCRPGALAAFGSQPSLPQKAETAYIIFTSGSTGVPKGVPISVRNLNHFAGWIASLPALRGCRNLTVLNQASFSFDLSVADFYYALCGGHTLTAFDGDAQTDFSKLFEIMRSVHVTVMTPTFMKLCLLNDTFCEAAFPNLKCAYFCGEMLENTTVQKLFAAFPHIRILNAYGPTEATSAVCAAEITKEAAASEHPLPVGDPALFAADITIENGEIVLRGESVSGGYLQADAGGFFCENGVNGYRSGDLGYFENGLLYCTGRSDGQIKYKGCRIELAEIEAQLGKLPGVQNCAVIAKRDGAGRVKLLKAFAETQTQTPQTIRAALQNTLPGYMIPKLIQTVPALPVNENGKTDRKALMKL